MKLNYRFNEWREGPPWTYDGDVTVLPSAGRTAMLEQDAPVRARLVREDLKAAGLMPDPLPEPTGTNAQGEAVSPTVDRKNADALEPESLGFLREGGWHAVSIKGGEQEGGLTAHRGVLAPGEYVNGLELQRLVEAELGYTYEQIRSVYRQGPLSPEQRKLRGVIDARMLALRRSGANMVELGRSIGFPIKASGNCAVLDNAVSRARAVEQWEANLQPERDLSPQPGKSRGDGIGGAR